MCYAAAQAVGGSICVPPCDPNDPDDLQRRVHRVGRLPARAARVPATPARTSTVRRRSSAGARPSRRSRRPTATTASACRSTRSCSTNADCTSPVFTRVHQQRQRRHQRPGLLTTGEICVQGKCSERGIACEPGSACVRDVLPKSIPAPDVCSPICTPVRDRKPGQSFNECLPGLTCLSDAFPQTDAPACAPGFPGWLCVDDIGCTAGGCYDWGDTSPKFEGFKTCAPPCKTDDDCFPYDRGGNPVFLSHNTCHDGVCRNFASMFFPVTCLRDERAVPARSRGQVHRAVDGHGHGDDRFRSARSAARRRSACTAARRRRTATTMAAALHIPMTCGTINQFSACVPMFPFIINCTDSSECYGDLTCEGPAGKSVCTRRCTSSADCADDPALGTTFTCTQQSVCAQAAGRQTGGDGRRVPQRPDSSTASASARRAGPARPTRSAQTDSAI